jgi:hypothetical protein
LRASVLALLSITFGGALWVSRPPLSRVFSHLVAIGGRPLRVSPRASRLVFLVVLSRMRLVAWLAVSVDSIALATATVKIAKRLFGFTASAPLSHGAKIPAYAEGCSCLR